LEADAANARLQASQAQEVAQRAEAERLRMKQELVQQLNVVLATRETARGLIVNMSDVLFDTARYTLKPGAREKLARISGIILAHPGLKIEVEGHTDNVGGMEYNQRLSEQRAESVRSFLVSNGVDSNAVTSRGFGLSKPVADNSNAAGRQANRRVELVVNGPMLSSRDSRSGGR
jgi:outer membrane protein OmpA-like peptidoglycan-associated protein